MRNEVSILLFYKFVGWRLLLATRWGVGEKQLTQKTACQSDARYENILLPEAYIAEILSCCKRKSSEKSTKDVIYIYT